MDTDTIRGRRTTLARTGLVALGLLAGLLAPRVAHAEVRLTPGQSKSRSVLMIVSPGGRVAANTQVSGVRVQSANPGIATARVSGGQLTITGVAVGRTSVTITGNLVTGGRRRGGLLGGLTGGTSTPFTHTTQVRVTAGRTGGGGTVIGGGAGAGGRIGGGGRAIKPRLPRVRVRVGQSRTKALTASGVRVSSANPGVATIRYANRRLVITGVKAGRTTVTISGTRIKVDGTLGAPPGSPNPPRIIRTPFTQTIQVEVVAATPSENEKSRERREREKTRRGERRRSR